MLGISRSFINHLTMNGEIFNANPTVYASKRSARKSKFEAGQSLWIDEQPELSSESEVEPIDEDEIFGGFQAFLTPKLIQITHIVTDLIRFIADPEHPNSLEELRVVSAEQIKIGDNHIMVEFTPTVPHCGMSTLIGGCFYNVLRIYLNQLLRAVHPCATDAKLASAFQSGYSSETRITSE